MSRAKGRALWLPDVLRDAGLPIKLVDGWETRGKEPSEWLAQVNHHTASNRNSGPHPALGIVTHGRGGSAPVPGPLANTLPDRNATIHIVASGAANHAGVAYLPLRGGISSGVKYWTLGHEIELDGIGEPFPVNGRLYENVATMNAAIAAYLGHDPATQLFSHAAIARPHGRKIDPRPYDLEHARKVVAHKMNTLGGKPTRPNPTPPTGALTVSEAKTINAKIDREVKGLKDRDSMVYEGTRQALARQNAFNKILVQFIVDKTGANATEIAELDRQMAELSAEVDALTPKAE